MDMEGGWRAICQGEVRLGDWRGVWGWWMLMDTWGTDGRWGPAVQRREPCMHGGLGRFIAQQKLKGCCKITYNFFLSVLIFRSVLEADGDSQARGWIGARAASLHHSHSNMGSRLCLWPAPQLTAWPNPYPTKRGQGSNLQPRGSWLDLFLPHHDRNSVNQLYFN